MDNALDVLTCWSAAAPPCDCYGQPYRRAAPRDDSRSSSSSSSSRGSSAGSPRHNSSQASTTPLIMFQGTVYNDTTIAALVDAIVAASTVQPHVRSLQTCVEGALKPVGLSRGITIHGSNARAVFEWHISRGSRPTVGQKTDTTCSLFGSRVLATSTLLLTAVGRHLRTGNGKQHYGLPHWRDGSIAIKSFAI